MFYAAVAVQVGGSEHGCGTRWQWANCSLKTSYQVQVQQRKLLRYNNPLKEESLIRLRLNTSGMFSFNHAAFKDLLCNKDIINSIYLSCCMIQKFITEQSCKTWWNTHALDVWLGSTGLLTQRAPCSSKLSRGHWTSRCNYTCYFIANKNLLKTPIIWFISPLTSGKMNTDCVLTVLVYDKQQVNSSFLKLVMSEGKEPVWSDPTEASAAVRTHSALQLPESPCWSPCDHLNCIMAQWKKTACSPSWVSKCLQHVGDLHPNNILWQSSIKLVF